MEDTSTFIIEKHLTINQGKNISIAYNGDRFVDILLTLTFCEKKKHLEIASASYSTVSAGSSNSVRLSLFDSQCVHFFMPVCI